MHEDAEFIRMDSENDFSEYTNTNMVTIETNQRNKIN